jgi:hypothetical protein
MGSVVTYLNVLSRYSPEDSERPLEMFIRLSGDSYLLHVSSRIQVSSARSRNIEPDPAAQFLSILYSSPHSSVGIATGYGLDDQGEREFRVPVGSKIFTSPYRPDRLWGPPNLL